MRSKPRAIHSIDLTLEIGTEMLHGLSAQEDIDSIKKRVRARFALPLGNPGHFIVEDNAEKLLGRFERALKKLPFPLPVLPQEHSRHTLHFTGHPLLSFSLPPIGDHILFFQAARSKEQAQNRMWFEYCCGVAKGIITEQSVFCLSCPGMRNAHEALFNAHPSKSPSPIRHHLELFQRMTGQLQPIQRQDNGSQSSSKTQRLVSKSFCAPQREKITVCSDSFIKWRSSGAVAIPEI